MKRALWLVLFALPAFAQEPMDAGVAEATSTPVAAPEPSRSYGDGPAACGDWQAPGLNEGPIQLGFQQADVATGRRACPRSEVGIGGRMGLKLHTDDFYGAFDIQALVYGSWALKPTTELFATLEAVSFNFAQNAVLTSTQVTLGNMTVGATQTLFWGDKWVLSATARVLLPTSLETPGAHLLGGELGASVTWRALKWLEVHGYAGGDVQGSVGRAAPLVTGGGVFIGGVQASPFTWGALAVDLTGRVGQLSYFAPSFALRFRVASLGIELAATLPVVGTDRHTVIGQLRLNWRF